MLVFPNFLYFHPYLHESSINRFVKPVARMNYTLAHFIKHCSIKL